MGRISSCPPPFVEPPAAYNLSSSTTAKELKCHSDIGFLVCSALCEVAASRWRCDTERNKGECVRGGCLGVSVMQRLSGDVCFTETLAYVLD